MDSSERNHSTVDSSTDQTTDDYISEQSQAINSVSKMNTSQDDAYFDIDPGNMQGQSLIIVHRRRKKQEI